MSNIKRIKRELVAPGHVIDYYHDTMLLPDGKEAIWDLLDHKGAAAVVAVKDDGKIILVRQYRNAPERETIELPAGGRLSRTEPTIECARRELEEETGYMTNNLEMLCSIYTTVAFCNEKIDIYLARDLKPGKVHLDPDEYVDVEEYTVEELRDMILSCKIQDAKTIAGIMCYINKYL